MQAETQSLQSKTKMIENLSERLETLKSDLRWQLSFEEIDWQYFAEFTERTKNISSNIEKLKTENQIEVETINETKVVSSEIIGDI